MSKRDTWRDYDVRPVVFDSFDHFVDVWLFNTTGCDQQPPRLGDGFAAILRDEADLDRILTKGLADRREPHVLPLPALFFEALENYLFEFLAVFEILERSTGGVQLELLEVIQIEVECLGEQTQFSGQAGARH